MSQIERYVDPSKKLQTEDLDWELAGRAGLTKDEQFILTYFTDIESQTIIYLRDILKTRLASRPSVIAFLTVWNYEEFFHGHFLAKLLEVCGHPLEENRVLQVRGLAQISEKIEAMASTLLSKVFPSYFPALYTTWGAIQEMTTLRGYERLHATTTNPILRELCDRIAKQERRHFAWYFNSAQEELTATPRSQGFTRRLLTHFWSPVGAGVKEKTEVSKLFSILFPEPIGKELAKEIDAKISELPGLAGLTIFRDYLKTQRAN